MVVRPRASTGSAREVVDVTVTVCAVPAETPAPLISIDNTCPAVTLLVCVLSVPERYAVVPVKVVSLSRSHEEEPTFLHCPVSL